MKNNKIDPLFDGHLEKRLKDMTPEEKLLYLSRQIHLKYCIKKYVREKNK
ncbi:MAG: hypothetical protein N2053_04330 [Chitinispirillaceae bacterium]|nr:hypothetical protein [Chitinispirillaceae bacterium]